MWVVCKHDVDSLLTSYGMVFLLFGVFLDLTRVVESGIFGASLEFRLVLFGLILDCLFRMLF